MNLLVVTLFLITTSASVQSFNIDIDNVIHFKGTKNTLFGYSAVMLNKDDGTSWVVVGAPKANFSSYPDIQTPGNVYKCQVNFTRRQQGDCEPMDIKTADVVRWPFLPGFEQDNELLGASMSVIDDKIITCAPLWKNMIPLKDKGYVFPVGRCFNIDKTLDTFFSQRFKNDKFSEYTKEKDNQFTFEFAQIGFSLSNKKYEDPVFSTLLGAPGFFENKGAFIQYNPTDETEQFFDSFTHRAFEADQRDNILMGTLLGYSITTGRINDPSCPNSNAIVLGAPHYFTDDGIVGSVLIVCAKTAIFGKFLSLKKQFFGKKSGCGFGSSVLFDDINNDGRDDLLVGAPLQYNRNKNVLDVGSVQIYYGHSDPNVLLDQSKQQLEGKAEYARFGSAMECIGDINKDGFKDVVIAAPFEDNLRGAIYIYHGGPTQLTLTQRITAEDSGSNLQTFGWYISAAYDIDRNQYPDFLVGSYMSDTVSVLRTRPIIKISNTLSVNPSVIPLNSSGTPCQDVNFRPCVSIHLCFSYQGINVPDRIMVSYNVSADILRTKAVPVKSSRAVLYVGETKQESDIIQRKIEVMKDGGTCETSLRGIVESVNREFFASLEEELMFEARFGLSDEPVPGDVQPVLDNKPTVKQAAANFSTGCNGTCHPNLKVQAQLDMKEIILGSVSEVSISIRVMNTGDRAHGTQLTIRYSNNTEYLGYFQPQDEVTELVFCRDVMEESNTTHVDCDLKRTLFQQQEAVMNVRFLVSRDRLITVGRNLSNFDQNIVFDIVAMSTSPDRDMADNKMTLTSTVKLYSKIEMSGISVPEQLQISEKGDGVLRFIHKYDVLNRGPSPLSEGVLYVCLPVKTSDGKTMSSKDDIKVTVDSRAITWRFVSFPGEINYIKTPNEQDEATSTISSQSASEIPTSTLPERESIAPNRKRRQTSEMLVQDQSSNKLSSFKEISCSRPVDTERETILVFYIKQLEDGEQHSFNIAVNISEKALNFNKISGIIYKSKGEVEKRDNKRYITTPVNETIEVSSEIFPREVSIEAEKINIWIIIGGCIGGLVLLIILGIILWKCGFFKRKKKDDLQKWKRQSGYYAKRQSARAGSTKSSNIKNVDWNP